MLRGHGKREGREEGKEREKKPNFKKVKHFIAPQNICFLIILNTN